MTTLSQKPVVRRHAAAARQSVEGLALLVGIVAIMWILEAVNSVDHYALDTDGGLIPRDVDRVWAIFTSPFLHASWPHLIDNTIPFVFMGVIIALHGAAKLALVTLIVIVVGGLGTWLIAPAGTQTVGASGVVFGYATYLFTRGLFERSVVQILTGVIVGVVWGGALVSSVVPHAGVSWQAHVCGAIGGVIAAWLLASRRNAARPPGPRGRDDGEEQGGRGSIHRPVHDAIDRALAQ
jgi:membrane associated rhomboid family serine protease